MSPTKKNEQPDRPQLSIVKDEPKDIRAALVLRENVVAFAKDAADRAILGFDDRAALERIHTSIRGGEDLHFAVTRGLTNLDLDAISQKTGELYELNVESTTIVVGSQRIDVPAIELVNIRQVVLKVANDLVNAIDSYITGRRAEVESIERTEREGDDRLASAKTIAALALYVNAYTDCYRRWLRHTDFGVYAGAVDDGARLLDRMIGGLEGEGVVPRETYRGYNLIEAIQRQERATFEAERKAAA